MPNTMNVVRIGMERDDDSIEESGQTDFAEKGIARRFAGP